MVCPPVPDEYDPLLNHWIIPCGGGGSAEDIWYWQSDQGVFHALTRSSRYPSDFLCHVKFVNMRDLNSLYPSFDDGDFIVHFLGQTIFSRRALFKDFLENVDVETGRRRNMDGLLANELDDWRAVPGLQDQYRGAGWNVGCRELTQHYT